MEFNPTQEAEARKHQQRVDVWLDPNDRVNVLDNEMYLARVNPDGSNRAMLPKIENLHEHDNDEYAELSLRELCEISVDSELNDDRTTMSSVDDYILDKIDGMKLEDDYADRDGSLRDKSELDNVFDRVMKLREDLKREKLLENPSNVSDLKDVQVNNLANAWENQTGKKLVWKDKTNTVEDDNSEREMLALPPAPEAPTVSGNGSEVEDDDVIIEDDNEEDSPPRLPRIRVRDDEPSDIADIADSADEPVLVPAADSNEKKSKRKLSRRQKVAAAAVTALVAGALLFGLNRGSNDSSEIENEPAATEVEAEEVDIVAPSEDAMDLLNEIDEAAENTSTGTETNAEETDDSTTDAEAQALKVALYSETGEQIEGKIDTTNLTGLDASKIVVSGDVWPFTNAVEAGAEDPIATTNAMLTIYKQAHPETNFELRNDGMYWTGDRVMNDKELKDYNELFQFIAANN